MPFSVAIVGGGITGVATAYYLEEAARQEKRELAACLIESGAQLGGKVLTEEDGEFLVEGGPDALLTYKPWALQLVKKLGLESELVTPNTNRVYLLYRGKLHRLPQGLMAPVPSSLWTLWRVPFLSWKGKARASLEPFIPPRRDTTDEALGSFLRRRLGDEWAQRLGEPVMASIYAGDVERLSLQALFPTLAEWERQYKSLFRGLRKAKTTMAATGPAHPFVSLARGIASIPRAMASCLPSHRLILGHRATGISRASERGEAGYEVVLDNGERLDATCVVLTTPAYVTAELLRDIAPEAAGLLGRLPYVSTASVTLAFRREAVAHPLLGSGFLVPKTESFPLTACTWSSSKWPGRAPRGFVLVRAYLGWAGDQSFVQWEEVDLVKRATEALRPLLGIRGQPYRAWAHRWLRAMPQYEVGHLEWLAAVERALGRCPGLLLAGSAYEGIGIPDCVRQAGETVERLRGIIPSFVNTSTARR